MGVKGKIIIIIPKTEPTVMTLLKSIRCLNSNNAISIVIINTMVTLLEYVIIIAIVFIENMNFSNTS